MNVVALDACVARDARLRLWSEHLEQDASGDPVTVIDELWRPVAERKSRSGSSAFFAASPAAREPCSAR